MTPLVSIIIPTKNSAEFLADCLQSILAQAYPSIETIVVDNHSTDRTLSIAQAYADKVFTHGPERSAQRNYGSKQAKGQYVLFIDSDMVLSVNVVGDCVATAQSLSKGDAWFGGIVIPEESFGQGFWAKCKQLEKSFYVGVDWMEAARFYDKNIFDQVGGWNEQMISGEDWDLSQRVQHMAKLARIKSPIYHNEGKVTLIQTVRKKYFYAKHFSRYKQVNGHSVVISNQMSPLARYSLFIKQPHRLFKNPLIGTGMLVMKTGEFTGGAIGYGSQKLSGGFD